MIDSSFRFFARLSSDDEESKEYKNTRKVFEAFITGIVKGSISNLCPETPDVKLICVKQGFQAFEQLEIIVNFRSDSKRKK